MRTLAQLRQQVKDDLDLDDDDFINDSDINQWIREGVRQAESQIHTLYENYFLVEATLASSRGQNLYDYPSDIFANKIVKIIYSSGQGSGSQTHEVCRVSNLADATQVDIKFGDNTQEPILSWLPINDATNGRKIRIFPSAGRNGQLRIFYIRNAKELNQDNEVCDIDEFSHYVVQYAKTKAYMKDGDPRATASKELEEQYKKDMIETLSNMAPDNNNHLDMDLDHYWDSV